MSSTGVRIGHNSVIRIGRGSTPVWTVLSGCKDIDLPDQKLGDVDVTSMDSPGRTEEFIAGLYDAPDWSVTKDYVPGDAEDVLLTALFRSAGEKVLLEITPNGAEDALVWQGWVNQWGRKAPVVGGMTGTLGMKILAQVIA